MSNFQNKPGCGALFHNDKKPEGSNQPDYRGNMKLLNGTDIELAIWVKLDKSGKKYLSISQSKPYKKQENETEDFLD